MKCSNKEALEEFFLHFRFQMYCSCFNYILHVTYHPSLNKLQNTFIKFLQTSHFAIARKSIFFSKKLYPKRRMRSIRSSGVEKFLFPACPGVGNRPPREKNGKSPRSIKQIKLNHAEMQSHAYCI